MKDILRKIFFWDVPAKGAFFGVTLLFVLPRFFYAIVFDIVAPVFLREEKSGEVALYLLAALIGCALLYAFIDLVHFLPKVPMTKKPCLIGLCCCAVLMIVFWISTDLIGDKEIYRRLWWVIPSLFVAWCIVYAFYPAVKVWEWLAAVVPLVIRGALCSFMSVALVREVVSELGVIPQSNAVFSFIGNSSGMQWLLSICCISLLAIAYLMLARVISKGGSVSFKSLWGKGVATLWLVFVVTYLASVCQAVYSILDYRKARKELDAYWGMPVTTKTLVELYAKNDNIDQAFWKEFNGQAAVRFPKFFNKYDGINLIVGYSNAILPPDIYVEWKKAFNESAKLRRCEEMMEAPPPLYERKAGFNFDRFFSRISSRCGEMARLEMWRVRFALEEKDIDTAKKALLRLDNIGTPLQSDYNQLAGLLWVAIEQMRTYALCRILASGLADEAWLREQSAILLEKERLIPEVHKRMILGEAAHTLDSFEMVAEQASFASFLMLPESWGFWGREGAVMARCFCISDFADFPEKPAAIFARMISNGECLMGTKKIPTLVATLRISRGLIEAEMIRLKTGAYPAVIDNLPEDPFSGRPLRYAIGEREIPGQRFQQNDDDNGDELEVVQQMQKFIKMTDEQAKELARHTHYSFKPEWHTVNAVQIWSVGPDGISGDAAGDDLLKSRDDIRYYIRLQ